MMATSSLRLQIFRWAFFVVTAGYCVYHLSTADWDNFGGIFRKLTFWGLFMTLYTSSRMAARSAGMTRQRYDTAVMCTTVVNTMVVFLYWKLYLTDPSLVHDDGSPGPWWDNNYLHALGPALQIFDALFIERSFRNPIRAVFPLLGVILIFVLWGEFVLQALSLEPVGSVTSGLPYPFLNNMELPDRLLFYGQNGAISLALLAVFSIIAIGIRFGLPRKSRA